jgi:hypothetical protein
MKKLLTSKKKIVGVVALALTLFIGLVAFGLFVPSTTSAGVINRLTAQFKAWDGDEISTTAAIPGIIIYSKTVTVPLDANTLFLTIATTGDCHDAAVAEFGAFLNGSPFNLGTTSSNGTQGWINLLNPFGDLHDNNINYTWCAPVQPGKKYLVELRLASDNGGEVFIEGAHFYIDATFLGAKNRCTEAP